MTETPLQKLAAEYAPYDKLDAFNEGFDDYQHMRDRSRQYQGVDSQAYDRGAECAMRLARQRDCICMGCGKKFAAVAKLHAHQTECKRFRLEIGLQTAQAKLKT